MAYVMLKWNARCSHLCAIKQKSPRSLFVSPSWTVSRATKSPRLMKSSQSLRSGHLMLLERTSSLVPKSCTSPQHARDCRVLSVQWSRVWLKRLFNSVVWLIEDYVFEHLIGSLESRFFFIFRFINHQIVSFWIEPTRFLVMFCLINLLSKVVNNSRQTSNNGLSYYILLDSCF